LGIPGKTAMVTHQPAYTRADHVSVEG